jgi:hypothetical protein
VREAGNQGNAHDAPNQSRLPPGQPPKVGQRRWHVSYEFCEVLARVTVRAGDEAEARTKAARQLRKRGLRGLVPHEPIAR